MKNYIKKSLSKSGKKYSQLYDNLKIKNKIIDFILFNSLYDLIDSGEVLKCYGGYYMLNN